MSDLQPSTTSAAGAPVSASAGGRSAGAQLRAAREAMGLDLELMSQVLKVPVAKLQAMEADRHDGLPGVAFVRGLAVSMSRHLGIDPKPVLDALPSMASATVTSKPLEAVTQGLSTPYREPGSRTLPLPAPDLVLRKAVWMPLVLVGLAAALWWGPDVGNWRAYLPWGQDPADMEVTDAVPPNAVLVPEVAASEVVQTLPAPVAPEAASAVTVPPVAAPASAGVTPAVALPASSGVIDTVFSVPRDGTGEAASAAAAGAGPSGVLVLRTAGECWVEVRGADGKVLLSRMVHQGEEVGLDGALPMRLKVGNANAASVTFRGQSFDLRPYTTGSVAKVELK